MVGNILTGGGGVPFTHLNETLLINIDTFVYYSGVGRVLTELGKVYQEQWYLTQALEAFERSHSIHEEFYGTRGHPEVNCSLIHFAGLGRTHASCHARADFDILYHSFI